MHIVDQTKLIIGIVLALVGIGMLVHARGSRGFNQRKQAGAMMLVAAIVFLAIGLGYLDLRAMMGR